MIEVVYPKVEIITTTSGNLLTMINKSSNNINVVLAGSDRVKGYTEQMKRNLDVQIEEVRRGEDDESATKVIRNLSDFKYFKSNTPRQIHKMYDELLKTYTQGESFRKQIQGKDMLKEIVEELNEAKDMKRHYDGFKILNKKTKKETRYPYIKGSNHVDVEDAAIRDQMRVSKLKRSYFTVSGFIQKGEM